jgi:carbonic anhydrase
MFHVWRLAFALSLGCSFLACKPQPEVAPEPKKTAKKAGAKTEKGAEARDGKSGEKSDGAEAIEPGKFIVPFAWEAAKDEPLAQTRAFLAEALVDNQQYAEHGDKFFAEFADKQTPRATVVTCADSRVHTPAWDVTPENDDFVIRNIGNQLENAEGSIEYGVEHLRTPLLLIIGHTGCGAVKAAMGDTSKLGPAIQKELEHIHLPKPAAGKSPEAAWAEAVIANVDNQVDTALRRFGKDVQAGQLTVVGAVFDFRNDLLRGAGKLTIVNVNGNSEPERMAAFVDAVSGKKGDKDREHKQGKTPSKMDDAAAAAAIADQLAKLRHGAETDVHEAGKAETKPERAEHTTRSDHE